VSDRRQSIRRRVKVTQAAIRACPACQVGNGLRQLCDLHRCTAAITRGPYERCRNAATYPELGVCGCHIEDWSIHS
jgi:hypothetical protein